METVHPSRRSPSSPVGAWCRKAPSGGTSIPANYARRRLRVLPDNQNNPVAAPNRFGEVTQREAGSGGDVVHRMVQPGRGQRQQDAVCRVVVVECGAAWVPRAGPYAALLLAVTTGLTPQRLAASSTLAVPPTFSRTP